ncbi:hypothetical protein BDN70DRAFT_889267 [Pholiota conissans]|uniref:Uncharacterized protein n=1 Tax=Pholiota conissans TaxID=109636 RepID=A0A9P5YJE3_9AGAR|nr:hypothetical protein BDN70DRAFT_889267 [Pholiota conissans]
MSARMAQTEWYALRAKGSEIDGAIREKKCTVSADKYTPPQSMGPRYAGTGKGCDKGIARRGAECH